MALMITSPHKKLKSKIEKKPRDTLKKKQKKETFFIICGSRRRKRKVEEEGGVAWRQLQRKHVDGNASKS